MAKGFPSYGDVLFDFVSVLFDLGVFAFCFPDVCDAGLVFELVQLLLTLRDARPAYESRRLVLLHVLSIEAFHKICGWSKQCCNVFEDKASDTKAHTTYGAHHTFLFRATNWLCDDSSHSI